MAMRGVDFKWYDGFFLSMLVTSVVIVSINWGRYRLCAHPLHIWIVVDYTAVFVFRLLMFLDNGLAAGMGLDLGWQQRYTRFCGRIVVLSVLVLLLYPFLWVWTVIGTLWFNSARRCLPEEGQKWGFLIWLLFSYCGLSCIACVAVGKWLNRRHALQLRAQQGIPISEYGVLVDMIRVPDWAFEAVGLELRGMGQDTAYHPGLYLTTAQREAVEALIQELPKFMLKAVPTDCSECPICLEEFRVGSEVRGLPCAHNFHVACIDQWLRLNVKCPRCRCSVFPNLDLSALNGIRASSEQDRPSGSEATTTAAASRYVPSAGQSYLVRLQGLLPRPVVVGHGSDDDDVESGERRVGDGERRGGGGVRSDSSQLSQYLSSSAADAGGDGEKALAFDAPQPPPQPVREDYVQNAVKFLSHPKVRGSAVVYRRSFLQNKGLTSEEIDEAFRRVPDPQPTAASPSTQTQPPPAAATAPQQTYAQPQSAIVVAQQHPRFTWYRAFVAAGLLLGFGASAAVFIKKLFLPRLKSWIRKVVAEAQETAELKSKIDEETKEAVRASSEAVSAIAKTNQELLASKDEEKKILVTLTHALDSQAKVLKSLSESLSHSRDSVNVTREDRFSHYRPLEDHAARNGPVNTPWRPPQQPNMYGVPNGDFGSAGRPSFAPAPTEPTSGSFSRSYVEQTVQRADRSSGSKPWEMQQYAQPKLGYGSSTHLSEDGSYSEAQENYGPSYHQNGKAPDFQTEEPRPLTYITGAEERPPPQRRWVPPQPPGVAMPEAVAAIRQPKSLTKQPSSDTSEAAGEMQVNGAQSSSSVAAEVPVNGSAVSDAGCGEIEEQVEAI
ncbi:hypothetical protein ACQ4PT_047394 [Festuca glaucescens]